MQIKEPDFYLVTGERSEPIVPTACWASERLRDFKRDDYMLVHISPEILGQKFGLGAKNIDRLILSTRLAGTSLYPIQQWPCHVYVMRIKNEEILTSRCLEAEDVEMISWGTLHKEKGDIQLA
jgi:hypothetical protein